MAGFDPSLSAGPRGGAGGGAFHVKGYSAIPKADLRGRCGTERVGGDPVKHSAKRVPCLSGPPCRAEAPIHINESCSPAFGSLGLALVIVKAVLRDSYPFC